MKPLSILYPEADTFRIPLERDLHKAIRDQHQDNKGALAARLQAIALQLADNHLKGDLLALLCEFMQVPTSAITEAFAIDSRRLIEVRRKEPISICSCLRCRDHLPDGDRRALLRQLRALWVLSRVEAGDLVESKLVYDLLCEGCVREYRYQHDEQLRADRLARQARRAELRSMSLAEYLKTKEWKARRNRVLIRAGNRCQTCGRTDVPLDVHHNSYERLGEELLEDLVALCRYCHEHFHGILPEAA